MVTTCYLCHDVFRDAYNLERHIEATHNDDRKSDDEIIETDTELKSNYEDDDENSETESNTSSHADTDTETTSDESDETNTIFQDLLDKTYESFSTRRQELIEENTQKGMNEKDAQHTAYLQLLPLYRKAFRTEYKSMLCKIQSLRKDPIHKAVMETAKRFRDEDDYDQMESVSAAVTKRKHLINRIVPNTQPMDMDSDDDDDED